MLIAFYLHRLFNGGIERVTFNLASEFSARGIRVDIVVDDGGWSSMQGQIPNAVRFVELGAKRIFERPFKLANYIKREKPAAIVAAQHFANEVAVLASALAGSHCRVAVWEHTTLSVDLASLPATSARRWVLPPVAHFAFKRADAIVAVSRGAAKDLSRTLALPLSSIHVVYNPVLANDLLVKAREPIEHPWFADGEWPVILGVGRLELAKDFEHLLEAFSLVRRLKHARLVILGEGSLRERLTVRIRELGLASDVCMPGFVNNPFAYLARARVFVLSSAWEGLPTVMIEALAVGTPVVSTDCASGPSEILDGGIYGSLVPLRRADLLADEIMRVLNSERKPKAVGDWLRQFTASAAADSFLQLLNPGVFPSSYRRKD